MNLFGLILTIFMFTGISPYSNCMDSSQTTKHIHTYEEYEMEYVQDEGLPEFIVYETYDGDLKFFMIIGNARPDGLHWHWRLKK